MQIDDLLSTINDLTGQIARKKSFIDAVLALTEGDTIPVFVADIWANTNKDLFVELQNNELKQLQDRLEKLQGIYNDLQTSLDEALK